MPFVGVCSMSRENPNVLEVVGGIVVGCFLMFLMLYGPGPIVYFLTYGPRGYVPLMAFNSSTNPRFAHRVREAITVYFEDSVSDMLAIHHFTMKYCGSLHPSVNHNKDAKMEFAACTMLLIKPIPESWKLVNSPRNYAVAETNTRPYYSRNELVRMGILIPDGMFTWISPEVWTYFKDHQAEREKLECVMAKHDGAKPLDEVCT